MREGGAEDRPGPAARGTNGDHEAPFGAEFKRLRDAARLTQEELASRAGLAAKAVSALERGVRRRPYPHTVRSLANALDLTDAERASLQVAVSGRGENAPAPEAGAPPAVPPAPATALMGCERDVKAVVGLIGGPETRLLTLTGPGGVGKTRPATEAASALLAAGASPAGPPSSLSRLLSMPPDASLVLPTIARSLPEAGETANFSPSASLRAYLQDKRLPSFWSTSSACRRQRPRWRPSWRPAPASPYSPPAGPRLALGARGSTRWRRSAPRTPPGCRGSRTSPAPRPSSSLSGAPGRPRPVRAE